MLQDETFLKTVSHIFHEGHRDPGGAWAVTLEGNVNHQVQVCGREERERGKVRIVVIKRDREKGEERGRRGKEEKRIREKRGERSGKNEGRERRKRSIRQLILILFLSTRHF
jgi:hypothetical protein